MHDGLRGELVARGFATRAGTEGFDFEAEVKSGQWWRVGVASDDGDRVFYRPPGTTGLDYVTTVNDFVAIVSEGHGCVAAGIHCECDSSNNLTHE